MPRVSEIYDFINLIAPFDRQEEWDNGGLNVGNPDAPVSAITVALDVTAEVIDAASQAGANLIVSHHPVIFKPRSAFLKGDIAFDLAARGISCIAAHTCLDCADGGVNDVLCELLGIEDAKPVPSAESAFPTLRAGRLKDEMSVPELAKLIKKSLDVQYVCVTAPNDNKPLRTAAVCGGAGGSFVADAARAADVYITGELKYHEALEACAAGLCVIEAGHFATEHPAMRALLAKIKGRFPDTPAAMAEQTDPIAVFLGEF